MDRPICALIGQEFFDFVRRDSGGATGGPEGPVPPTESVPPGGPQIFCRFTMKSGTIYILYVQRYCIYLLDFA